MTSHTQHANALPPEAPLSPPSPDLMQDSPVQAELPVIDPPAESPAATEKRTSKFVLAAKWAGGLTLTTYLLFGGAGGEQQASAEAPAPLPVATAEAPITPPAAAAEANPAEASESDSGPGDFIPLGLSVLAAGATVATAGAGVAALRKQTKEKVEERFTTAKRDLSTVTEATTGESRLALVTSLNDFKDRPEYRPRIFTTALQYLQGRRSGMDALKKANFGDTHDEAGTPVDSAAKEALDKDISSRRYADRAALKIFLETLPDAREAVKNKQRSRPIRDLLKRSDEADKFSELAARTNAEQEPEETLVNARGINLDSMRGIDKADLSGVDMSGAGLKYDNFTLVDFSGSRLREVHLRKSIIAHSNLEGTDLRAAYLNGAVIKNCLVNRDTKMGRLPETNVKAKLGGLDYENMDTVRGNGEVVLNNLMSDELNEEQIVSMVKDWQRNGLQLLAGSDHKYWLDPNADPNWTPPQTTQAS